jgi:hypothetical protein
MKTALLPHLRFWVVGAPRYLEHHGTPQRPEDLLRHECITFLSQTTGAESRTFQGGGSTPIR